MSEFFTGPDLFLIEEQIDTWLANFKSENPTILAIDRDEGDIIRWYVRVAHPRAAHAEIRNLCDAMAARKPRSDLRKHLARQ